MTKIINSAIFGLLILASSLSFAEYPNQSYSSNYLNRPLHSGFIKGGPGSGYQNQPAAHGGYIVAAGNGVHVFIDISNPFSPRVVEEVRSPAFQSGREQENHQITFAKYPDGKEYLATVSGRGVDIWDVTDIGNGVSHVSEIRLPGINYGDVDGAVWGVGWQGKYLYVGATNQGIFVIDMSNVRSPRDAVSPSSPNDYQAVPSQNWNNIKAGPVFPIGNLLTFGAPKDANGVVTLDVSDPGNPVTLDTQQCIATTYITWFYGKWVFCEERVAIYDVTTSPRNIRHVATANGPASEYMSFGDDYLYLGALRPNPGIYKYDLSNISSPRRLDKIVNPNSFGEVDDQFSVPIGNLLFISDDQIDRGGFVAVHDTAPDTKPPRVMYANPEAGTVQPTTSRMGVSFSDQIDLRSVDTSTFVLRELPSGTVVDGYFGINHTVVNFAPSELLKANTQYELYLPRGGIKDLVGNGLDQTYSFRFETNEAGSSGEFGGGDGSIAPDPNGNVYVEAENMSMADGVVSSTDNGGYTGSGFADFPTSGGELSQAIKGSLSGGVEVQIRYSNGSGSTRSLTVEVGGQSRPVDFPATASWTSWGTVSLNFQGGTGSQVVLRGGSGPGPNVDNVSVSGVQASGVTELSCEFTGSGQSLVNAQAAFASEETSASSYTWTVGDTRYNDQGAIFNHVFTEPGRYSVSLTVSSGTSTKQCTKTQIVHYPLTSNAPVASSPIIIDDINDRVWNVNPDNNSVSAINKASGSDPGDVNKLLEIAVGKDPRSIAQAANGDIWVVNHDDASISVINPVSNSITRTIALPYASQPVAIAFTPSRQRAFVSLQAIGQIAVLDGNSGTLNQTIKLNKDAFGFTPKVRGLAVSADGTRLYATRFISNDIAGEVYEFDAVNLVLLDTIRLAIDKGVVGADDPDDTFTARGLPNYMNSISITPDGREAWVTAKKDNIERGLFSDGREPTFDSTTRTIVAPINLVNGTDIASRRIDFNDADSAMATVFSPYGDIVFTAIQGNKEIHVYDVKINESIAVIEVGFAPQGLVLDSEGYLYVHNFMSRSVSVVDVSELISGSNNVFTVLAEVPVVSNENLSATVLKGKQIFYNSRDVRMTEENYISCATCHLDGGEDGRVFDFANRGEGKRNTITLRGRRGTGHGPVHWTGNFDEIQDFEHDIRGPFGGIGFIDDALFASGTVNQTLGDPKAGLSEDLDALAEYLASLDRVPDSPYRNPDGSLTPAGVAGKRIFERLDCRDCHSGPDYTDSALNQFHDVGTTTMLSGSRLGGTLPGFDTPTLKGVWNTPPYFHDGSALDLYDVIDVPGHGNAQNLSDSEKAELVSYLLQLDENAPFDPETADPEPVVRAGSLSGLFLSSLFCVLFAVCLRRLSKPKA